MRFERFWAVWLYKSYCSWDIINHLYQTYRYFILMNNLVLFSKKKKKKFYKKWNEVIIDLKLFHAVNTQLKNNMILIIAPSCTIHSVCCKRIDWIFSELMVFVPGIYISSFLLKWRVCWVHVGWAAEIKELFFGKSQIKDWQYSRFRERDTDLDVCIKRHHSEPLCLHGSITSMFWSKSHGGKCCMIKYYYPNYIS